MAKKSIIEQAFAAALAEARRGVRLGHGGPFGAVVVKGDRIVGRGHNTVVRDSDPTAHAEMNAIRQAAKRLGDPWLKGCRLVATSEPCPMCLSAAYWARIGSVHFGMSLEAAAQLGFADADILKEIRRAPAKRRLLSRERQEFAPAVGEIMADWRRLRGRRY